MTMEKYCISLDWLQVCGYSQNLALLNNPPTHVGLYELQVSEQGTRTFQRLIKVCQSYGGDLIELASVQCLPRSSALRQELCIVKMANRVLYSQTAFTCLINILRALNIRYKGITRIDFAYDCNRFKGGVSPERFLRKYVSTPFESPQYVYRKNTKKFAVHMSRNKSGSQRIEYVKWGSDNSNKCCYIYNKSLELKEVKDKPWIRETWEKNGLLNDAQNQVFRCEISIKSDGMDLINLDSGQLFRLQPEYMLSQRDMERLFYFYAAQMFAFYRRNNHKRVRDFDRVEIFENSPEITCKPIRISHKADTGRTELICARKLEELSRTYTDAGSQFVHSIQQVLEFMYQVSGNRRCIKDVMSKIDYLNTLKGFKWVSDMDYRYFACIEALRIAEKELNLDPWKVCPEQYKDLEEPSSLQLYFEYLEYCKKKSLQP